MNNHLQEFTAEPMIAYFSMEIGVKNDIPTYSGGLGILAGDTIKSAADLDLPLVAVTLITHKGYFNQEIDANGWQKEKPVVWDPAKYMTLLPAKVKVPDRGQGRRYPGLDVSGHQPHGRQGAYSLPGHGPAGERARGPGHHGLPLRRGHRVPDQAGGRARHGRRAHAPGPRIPHQEIST